MEKKGYLKKGFKFITDIISWTCLCILILIIICLIWYVVSAKIYASKGEKYSPYFSLYTIISPSMEPNINVYDVILDTRVDDINNIKVGDVITFISSGNLSAGMTITHRVVEILDTKDGLRFRTKGDNNQSPDAALVIPDNVLGKTLLKIPYLGRVQFLLAERGGWFIIVLLPALGIIIYDIIKLLKVLKLKNKVDKVTEEKEEIKENKQEIEEKRIKEIKEKLNLIEQVDDKKSDIKTPINENKKSDELFEPIPKEFDNVEKEETDLASDQVETKEQISQELEDEEDIIDEI